MTIVFIFLLNKNNQENFSNETTKIPKIIVQTWKDNNIPEKYISEIKSVKNLNPDYKYIFFTDKDIEDFLKNYYPEYLKTYNKLPIKIQKIDFFRYIAIYHFGGFYLDLDITCLENFDDLLNFDSVFPLDLFITKERCDSGVARYVEYCKRGVKYFIGQYAFGASKNNDFIKVLIDNIHNNIDEILANYELIKDGPNLAERVFVYDSTGPDYVTRMYLDYDHQDKVHVLEFPEDQCFGKYAKHNHFGTWK